MATDQWAMSISLIAFLFAAFCAFIALKSDHNSYGPQGPPGPMGPRGPVGLDGRDGDGFHMGPEQIKALRDALGLPEQLEAERKDASKDTVAEPSGKGAVVRARLVFDLQGDSSTTYIFMRTSVGPARRWVCMSADLTGSVYRWDEMCDAVMVTKWRWME